MRDEPLETLQMLDSLAGEAERHTDALLAQYEGDLATLERVLGAPGSKPAFPHLRSLSRFAFPARVPAALLRRTEEAARRVWTSTGSGKSTLEEGLMRAVAFNADPSSLLFFRDALALTRARDTLTTKRRRWAVAGIAFTALKSGDREASATLDGLLTHDDLRVRTWAVDAIARTRRTRGEKLTAKAAELLERVAREDRAFEPRFVARAMLHAAGREVTAEPPGGVYAFKATFGRASRTVELRSEQTLDQLAWAIVRAFGWDNDHLYAFTLSTELEDDVFQVAYEGNPWTGEGAEEGPLSMPVGALGLVVGHRFTMLYDFGDHNVFAVQLVEAKEKVDARAKYPRVAATAGKAPTQYR
jgi:hypothetical protein